ncbi:MAG TPA: hypothetical protein VF272_01430, partial [Candidatus Saccharimonadia bacterium]
PSVMVIAVVLISLWGTASFSLASAIGGGLLLDMASGSDFGLRMAFFVVISLAIVAGRQLGLQADSWFSALALVALATFLYNAVIVATLQAGVSGIILGRVGADMLITTTLALVVYGVRLLILANRPVLQKLTRDVWQ